MNRKQGVLTVIFIVAVSISAFFFIGSPMLDLNDQTGNPGLSQNPESISTVQNDIESCVANPTADCDQEMQQIPKFCEQNKDQNISYCSDPRVQMYLDQRGLLQSTINVGK